MCLPFDIMTSSVNKAHVNDRSARPLRYQFPVRLRDEGPLISI